METDLEFVQRCVRGERRAWDEFLTRYSRLIYASIFTAARCSGVFLSPAEKDDIFQETVLSLLDENFRRLRSFRGLNGCRLASWLRQVTINLTLRRISRQRPGFSLDEEDAAGVALKETLADPGMSSAEAAQSHEEISRLAECIESLELRDKYFLELNLQLGLNIEEIKEHLKITRGAADMRKARIVERLRDCFQGKGMPGNG